jgi:hypothetical protein
VPWSIEPDKRLAGHSLDTNIEPCYALSICSAASPAFPPPVPPPRCG